MKRVRSVLIPVGAAFLLQTPGIAQQPHLWLLTREMPRQSPLTTQIWSLFGRPGDVYGLLADVQTGRTNLLGAEFDLAFSPSVLLLNAGLLGFAQSSYSMALQPSTLPAGVPIHSQFAAWAPAQGLGSLMVSNMASFAAHDGAVALVFAFDNFQSWPDPMQGVFDRGVQSRLQASPPVTRRVRPLPPQASWLPWISPQQPLNPAGARFQQAFRAEDLGANGLPEHLVAVRWRPLFGLVAAESYPQFELRAAHSDVVPNYALDPLTYNPVFPGSGLQPQFASNVRPGSTPVALCNGQYDVLPQQLDPRGYMPFPVSQSFAYDGVGTLLLETLCSPRPGLGAPQNFQVLQRVLPGVYQQPSAMLYASAGIGGQPSPLSPAGAVSGIGEAALYDWELEFERSLSVATSPWSLVAWQPIDFQAPIVSAYTPSGTSILIEYRGANSPSSTPTAWSTSPDIADGFFYVQFRVTMQANPQTGAVPWVESLILPLL